MFHEIKTHKLKKIKIGIFRKKRKMVGRRKQRKDALFKAKMGMKLVLKWERLGSLDEPLNYKKNR